MVTLSLFLDYYNQRLTRESLRISCPDFLLANRTQTKRLNLFHLTILRKISNFSNNNFARKVSGHSLIFFKTEPSPCQFRINYIDLRNNDFYSKYRKKT